MKRFKEHRFIVDYDLPWKDKFNNSFFINFIPEGSFSSSFNCGDEINSGYRRFVLSLGWLGFEVTFFYRWFTD